MENEAGAQIGYDLSHEPGTVNLPGTDDCELPEVAEMILAAVGLGAADNGRIPCDR